VDFGQEEEKRRGVGTPSLDRHHATETCAMLIPLFLAISSTLFGIRRVGVI
jgi:hypothetical protein